MKHFLLILFIGFSMIFAGCSPTDNGHDDCPGHNGHFHNSEINHGHNSSYNTPCGSSHGHCH